MYMPGFNRITDQTLLHDLMRQFSFATLVTVHDGLPFASHLPFLVYPDRGPHGCLVAHLARANPQWKDFTSGAEAMVIFQGHHAYISPSWYEVHPSVPTWNYMVVHAYGVPQVLTDEARVDAALRALVDTHEAGFELPWSMDALPDDYLRKMMQGVVAFELPIARLEGKFKLSQNRSPRDRGRVIEALAHDAHPDAQGVHSMMRAMESAGSGREP